MNFTLLPRHLTPAEGELTVRAYHCTTLASRLVNLKAQGYLTVTNKRVVFYARGSSYGGESVMHSEVPVADVSGINTYKGTYFSISHLLGAFFASFVVGSIISAIVTAVVGIVTAALIKNSADVNEAQIASVFIGILAVVIIIGSRSFARDKIWRPILAGSGTFLLAASGSVNFVSDLAGSLFGNREGGLGTVLLIGAFIAGIYALVTFFQYAVRETMSLTIGSKGGAYTPIAITGVSVLGIFNTAALKALSAGPASDAEAMIREIGAVISDIQTLGDLGVDKWKRG